MIFLRSPGTKTEKKQRSFLNRRSQRSQRVTVFKSHRRHLGLHCLNLDQQRMKHPLNPHSSSSSSFSTSMDGETLRLPTTFSVQRSAFSVQRSAFSVQRSTFNVQRSTFSVQDRGRRTTTTTTTIRKQASIHSPHLNSLPSLPIVLVLRRRPSSSISSARARHGFASSSPASFLRGNAFSQQHP